MNDRKVKSTTSRVKKSVRRTGSRAVKAGPRTKTIVRQGKPQTTKSILATEPRKTLEERKNTVSCIVCLKDFADSFEYSTHFDLKHSTWRDFAVMIVRGLWRRLTGGFK